MTIYSPKDPLPKFQPPIRSESARIKTRTEREHIVNLAIDPLCPSFDPSRFTSNWRLKFLWWVFGTINHQFFAKGLKSLDFRPAYYILSDGLASITVPACMNVWSLDQSIWIPVNSLILSRQTLKKLNQLPPNNPIKLPPQKLTINQYFIAHRMRRFPINQPVKSSLIELNVVWPITGQFLLHFRVASFHDFCNWFIHETRHNFRTGHPNDQFIDEW